jgi:hypothetical protein
MHVYANSKQATRRNSFAGLYGKTNMDAAYVDVVCETVADFFQALFPAMFGSDEAVKVTT